jgi:hypothetical protein
MNVVGDRQVRIVPNVSVSGNSQTGGLVDALLGNWMHDREASPQENRVMEPDTIEELPTIEPSPVNGSTSN